MPKNPVRERLGARGKGGFRYGVPVGEVMRPLHPRWTPFYNRLAGPEFCNFHYGVEGDPKTFKFRCKGGTDKTFARRLLREMGFTNPQIEASCVYFESRGGFCDCEILWNVGARRTGRRLKRIRSKPIARPLISAKGDSEKKGQKKPAGKKPRQSRAAGGKP